MQHNVYLEWSINGKAYYQAYRGLCKMRICFAKVLIEDREDAYDTRSVTYENMQRQVLFWTKVKEYWKKKLEESFTKEKEYFGE